MTTAPPLSPARRRRRISVATGGRSVLLFRPVDLPRVVRRLTPPLPLAPDAAGLDDDDAMRGAWVEWSLRPALLKPRSERERDQIARVLALYAAAEGRPRSAVEALAVQVEDICDDYRLARCLARTIEAVGYHFAPAPRALPLEPVALRAHIYRRVQESHGGYVPRARRGAFLDELAAELGATTEQVEATMWADRPGAAILRAGPAPADAITADGVDRQAAEPVQPARVIAQYNVAAVATLLSASAWVTLFLPATDTAALKDLYRHAKAAHVGVEIAVPMRDEHGGASVDLLAVTLFGPGSRALVRGRRVRDAGTTSGVDPSDGAAGLTGNAGFQPASGAVRPDLASTPAGLESAEAEDDAPGAEVGATAAGFSVPAPGGAPVAAVVTRLARRHPAAIREGWTRLLGPDGRLFHVALDEASLAALRGGAEPDSADGEVGTVSYDSAVEADFARAFLAEEAGGRLGVARGWTMEREPRAVAVDGSVFLPDFSFRRGDVEVFCEVIGYYTEDYLARKARKLAHLRGRMPLLLVVDQERAALFAACGFPMVTYRAGRQVGATEVARALDAAFDPFARRRAPAVRALAALCAGDGPRLTEEEVCAAIGCAGRTELTTLWSDLLSGAIEGADGSAGSGAAPLLWRRYVPGYGLAPAASLAGARAALDRLLDDAVEGVSLEDALACCEDAGVADPDDAIIGALGGVVVRAGLFGAARVYRAGDDADSALVAALSAAPSGRRRAHRA